MTSHVIFAPSTHTHTRISRIRIRIRIHIITTYHSYAFPTSREGERCGGFTNKQTDSGWHFSQRQWGKQLLRMFGPKLIQINHLKLKWCCAICISRGLIWPRVCYLTLSQSLFGANYVVMITQYWSLNHFHHQWIGRQNTKLQIKCIPVSAKKYVKNAPQARFSMKQNAPHARFINKMRRRPKNLTQS